MTAALTAICILGVTVLLGLVLLAPAYRLIHAVGLIALPLAASLIATGYRFSTEVLHDAYIDVPSDTSRYLEFGRYRYLEGAAAGAGLSDGNGTDATIALSQTFFSVLGDNPFAVFLAGSMCGLLGCWLLAGGLATVAPMVPARYAYAICLFPSVVYWRSSFGKDAVTFLAIGLAFWAFAHLAAGNRHRIALAVPYGGAVALMVLIRVDIGVVLLIALLLSGVGVRRGARMRGGWLVAVFVLVPIGLLVATQLQLYDPWGIIEEFAQSYERTSIGESQIGGSRATGIAGFVTGLATALFRPLPWESGLGGLISSVDVIPIVVLAVLLARTATTPAPRRTAPAARALIFAGFIALSLFAPLTQYGNLGLMVRLRSLAIPLLLILIALLRSRRAAQRGSDGAAGGSHLLDHRAVQVVAAPVRVRDVEGAGATQRRRPRPGRARHELPPRPARVLGGVPRGRR